MRRCFIHIGTHKTGTSSVQVMFAKNASWLRSRGFLYPQAGRFRDHPGHHNLAWQIAEDHRFLMEAGTIDRLVEEVASEGHTVILSSEDFECALHHTDRFAEFTSRLQSLGFAVTVILYVRQQCDYLPRLYLTLVPFGLNQPFAPVLSEVLTTGGLIWRDWIFNFDYLDLAKRVECLENVRLIVRPYDEIGGAVCADILSVMGLTLADMEHDREIVTNVSLALAVYFTIFLRSRRGQELSGGEQAAVTKFLGDNTTIELSPGIRRSLMDRFEPSNRLFRTRYGILDAKTFNISNANHAHCIDALFSTATERRFFEFST